MRDAADAGTGRSAALPLVTLAFLAAGAASLATGGDGGELAGRIWLVGLVLTGAPVVWSTAADALRGRFATDLVAMLSIVGAVLVHEPLAGLVIVLMRAGGEALDRYAQGRASAAVRELEAAAPRIAHRIADGHTEDLPADAIRPGDLLLVRPGELVPTDAVVVDGRSAVDVSRLTGEPLPLDARPGTPLLSGSANGDAPLKVRSTAEASASAYARIVQLVRTAQAGKAPTQRLADRYAVWFTPLTLVICAATWLATGDAVRVLTVLVVATPCPLILATPIAFIGGISRAARSRIVVRSGAALERLADLSTVVFDKTGTLTIGRPEVTRVVTGGGWSKHDLLRLAGGLEHEAGHLLARSLVDAAERALGDAAGSLPSATMVTETAGRGITGTVAGHRVTVGSRSFVLERERIGEAAAAELESGSGSTAGLRAYVAIDGALVGLVAYADRLRDDARSVVQTLEQIGLGRTILLSGDEATNVAVVAEALGLTEARADLLPEDKVAFIDARIRNGERVLMVGDGINDAPAMARATVGIALAAHGGGITAEAADVVLLTDDLSKVPDAVRIGRRTLRIARQSLAVGLGLSMVAMIVAALGGLTPTIGALLQEGIDVAVILNALRTSR